MKPRRRYLQFSLGSMFLAVTLLCIWLGVQVKWIRDRQEARKWLQEHDCFFTGGYDAKAQEPAGEIAAPWPIRAFGESGVRWIEIDPESDNAPTLERMEKLFPEAIVSVALAPVMPP